MFHPRRATPGASAIADPAAEGGAPVPGTPGSAHGGGLTTAEAAARIERYGANEIPEPPTHPFLDFASKFWGLSAWMLELVVVLSFLLDKRADAWLALALLVFNAVLGFVQERRASAAVALLRQRLQVTCRVLRDGHWLTSPARELVVEDVIRIRAGDFVSADAKIRDGSLRVDESALTGESREIDKGADDVLHGGSIVRHGEATAVVTATGARTYFGRTAVIVESARPRFHVEAVTTRVVKWLAAIVAALVSVALVASVLAGMRVLDVLPLALVLLMSAVPVALPVMFTVSMAIGSIELARRGVLVTRLSAVEDAANMDVLCADKTGTLTMNRLTIAGTVPEDGFSGADVLRDGALASNESNQDPIDLAFLRAACARALFDPTAKVIASTPFSPATRRTEALVEVGGRNVRVVKGALRTIAEIAGVSPPALEALEARASDAGRRGARVLAVARAGDDGPLRLVGLAFLHDAPRADSRRLLDELRALGIGVKMLTGDALPVAQEIARELGMGPIVRAHDLRAAREQAPTRGSALARGADGLAEVFPEDKFLVVKSLQAAGHVVGMTGDGVNDAPALRQAEVGIAVSDATDVAKRAASVVLTTEGLASIVDLVKHGRETYQRVLSWILNKVSQTVVKAAFVVSVFLFTGKFVISALGMLLLVFVTDFVKIALATDRVHPSQRPETWRIGPFLEVAVVLGILTLVEALGLLAIGWHHFDLAGDDGRLQTFAVLVLLFFELFALASLRERGRLWASRPSRPLATALAAAAGAGVALGACGLAELRPIPLGVTGIIIVYTALLSGTVNDCVKARLLARASARVRGRGATGPPRAQGAS